MLSRLVLSIGVIYLFATITNAQDGLGTCCDINDRDDSIGGACREGCACCPDGTWIGSIGDAKTYPCDNGKNTLVVGVNDDEFGAICATTEAPATTDVPATTDACCDINDRDNSVGGACREGCACCPDGTWIGSTGDAKTYPCNNGKNTLVVGVDDDKFGAICATTEAPATTVLNACCDINDRDNSIGGACREGCACCPDGTWIGSTGDAKTYPCDNGKNTLVVGVNDDEFGAICATTEAPATTDICCDINDRDNSIGGACREGCACCPDGSWVGSIGDAKTYPCDNGKNTLVIGTDDDEFGEVCPTTTETPTTCCDINDRDNSVGGTCREGCACCPDGTWIGSIGDAKTYPCNNGKNTLVIGVDDDEFGEVCPTTTNSDDDYCDADDIVYANIAQSRRWDNSLSDDGDYDLCELCLCDEVRSPRICEKIANIANWPDEFLKIFDYKFSYICSADSYVDLQDEDGNQCDLKNIRVKSTSKITRCWCDALYCCKESECDLMRGNDANIIGTFGAIGFVLSVFMWM